jgi:hypothetical protein
MSPRFSPTPVYQNGRMYFWRSEIERHKRQLAGLPPLEPNPDVIDVLVPAARTASEFGWGRRSLGRQVVESQNARARVALLTSEDGAAPAAEPAPAVDERRKRAAGPVARKSVDPVDA